MTNLQTKFEGRSWKYWSAPETIAVDGVPTVYRRSGDGEVVLYLHGTGETREWNALHRSLAASVDVIAPEHPGFGDTPRAAHQDTWEDYVLHYDGFLRTLRLEKVHLVGTAFGAWLASHLAVYYPERFKTLTLITPMGMLVEDEPFVDMYRMPPQEQIENRFNGRAALFSEDIAQEGHVEDAVRLFDELSTAVRLTWNPRYEPKFDTRLSRVKIPSLLIAAEDDRLLGNGQAQKYATLLPSSTLVTIAGPNGEQSSHGLTIEQPGEVAAAILRHVKTNS